VLVENPWHDPRVAAPAQALATTKRMFGYSTTPTTIPSFARQSDHSVFFARREIFRENTT
jgi:hypothetical protein